MSRNISRGSPAGEPVLKQKNRMEESALVYRAQSMPSGGSAPPLFTLILQTLFIVLTNLITIYGVVRLGWNAVPLVLMFILEGIIVLVTDFVKLFFSLNVNRIKTVFLVECLFILFYGFFAAIVFGPYDSLQSAMDDGLRIQFDLISGSLHEPLIGLLIMRLLRLVHDLVDSGALSRSARRPLQFDGGRLMLLLFFAIMLAPLITWFGPNPTGGLVALVSLKIFGELFGVWAVRVFKGVSNERRFR